MKLTMSMELADRVFADDEEDVEGIYEDLEAFRIIPNGINYVYYDGIIRRHFINEMIALRESKIQELFS